MTTGGARPGKTSTTDTSTEDVIKTIESASGTITIAEDTIKDIKDKGIIDAMISFVKKVGNEIFIKTKDAVIKGTEDAIKEFFELDGGAKRTRKTKINILRKLKSSFMKGGARPSKTPTTDTDTTDDTGDLVDVIKSMPPGSTVELTEDEVNTIANDPKTGSALKDIAEKAGITILTYVAGKAVELGSKAILDFLKSIAEKGLYSLAMFLFTGGLHVPGHKQEPGTSRRPPKTKKIKTLTGTLAKKLVGKFRKGVKVVKKVVGGAKCMCGGADEKKPEEQPKEQPKEEEQVVESKVEIPKISNEIEPSTNPETVKGTFKINQIANIKTSGSLNDRLRTIFYSRRR